MYEAGCSGLAHWDDPERWDGEGGSGWAQAGIKIAGRNINNLRYADDTTLRQKVKKN